MHLIVSNKRLCIRFLFCIFSAYPLLAMQDSLINFREEVVELLREAKYSPSFVPTTEKEITWKKAKIKATVSNYGRAVINFFNERENLIGTMTIDLPLDEFVYSFKFVRQDLEVGYDGRYRVSSGENQVLPSDDLQCDYEVLWMIHHKLSDIARPIDISRARELFLETHYKSPDWFRYLRNLAKTVSVNATELEDARRSENDDSLKKMQVSISEETLFNLQTVGLDNDKWKKVVAILMAFGVCEDELQINKEGITIEGKSDALKFPSEIKNIATLAQTIDCSGPEMLAKTIHELIQKQTHTHELIALIVECALQNSKKSILMQDNNGRSPLHWACLNDYTDYYTDCAKVIFAVASRIDGDATVRKLLRMTTISGETAFLVGCYDLSGPTDCAKVIKEKCLELGVSVPIRALLS